MPNGPFNGPFTRDHSFCRGNLEVALNVFICFPLLVALLAAGGFGAAEMKTWTS